LFVLNVLHQPASALGLVGGAWGLGMLFGSASAPSLTKRFSRPDLLWVSILVVGGSVVLASRSPTLTPVLLLWLIAGAANALGTIAYETVLQQETPDEFRGRVFAASEGVLNVCYLVGVAVAGGLGAIVGIRWAFLVGGVVFLVAGLLSRRLLRAAGTSGADTKESVILEQGYLQGVPIALPGVPNGRSPAGVDRESDFRRRLAGERSGDVPAGGTPDHMVAGEFPDTVPDEHAGI
jgi:MFS family permease